MGGHAGRRAWLGLAAALAAGTALAALGQRPGFDDTAVLVLGVVVAAAVAAVLAGPVGLPWLAAITAATGAPIPVAELVRGGSAASLVALGLAAAGAGVGAVVVRALRADPDSSVAS